jgi:FLYWCH-type zinc finger protein
MADSTILSFTTSNRGKLMLIYSGYVYRLKKSTKKVKYWVCQSNSCAANVHTNANNQFVKSNGEHQHLPAPEYIELRDLKKKVKERVESETLSVPKIYEEELARSDLSSTALILAPLPVDASKLFIYFNF